MTPVRFLIDDRYGAWKAGEIGEDLGRESDHPDAPNHRVIRTAQAGELSLLNPYGRGIVVAIDAR